MLAGINAIPGSGFPEKYDRGGGIPTVYGYHFWKLCMALGCHFSTCLFFLGYEFNVMVVSGAVCAFH